MTMKPAINTTPLVKIGEAWIPMLLPGKTLEWGHRFDAGIGYRLFVKYTDDNYINCFLAEKAREVAKELKKSKDPQVWNLGLQMYITAAQVDKMNKLWADAGAPDVPVDQIKQAGHA